MVSSDAFLDRPRRAIAATLVVAAVVAGFGIAFTYSNVLFSSCNSLFIVLAVVALAQSLGILGLLLGPMVAVAIQAAVEQLARDQLADVSPANDLAALDARIAQLKAGAAYGDELPQEWSSIVDRLAALIAEAQETDIEAPRESVT